MTDTAKDTPGNSEQNHVREDSKHPLENQWTLWFDVGTQGRQSQQQFGAALRSVYTFSTVEDFWCLYNNIKQPSMLPVGTDFHLFKKGIDPKWEDPKNQGGGKWTIQVRKGGPTNTTIDTHWLNALMACIGEHFTNGDDICGIVINIRGKQDRLSIWTRTASNEAVQTGIGRQLKAVLDLDGPSKIGYTAHEDSKYDRATAKYQPISRVNKGGDFGKPLHCGSSVLDLGCSPGAWLQVAAQFTKGYLVGVDLKECDFPRGCQSGRTHLIAQDVRTMKIDDFVKKGFGTILSDLCPKTSGIRMNDTIQSAALAEVAMQLSLGSTISGEISLDEKANRRGLLLQNGNLVLKLLEGGETKRIVKQLKTCFKAVHLFRPQATRSESKEIYIVGLQRINASVKTE